MPLPPPSFSTFTYFAAADGATFLNGTRLEAGVPTCVPHGSLIGIGSRHVLWYKDIPLSDGSWDTSDRTIDILKPGRVDWMLQQVGWGGGGGRRSGDEIGAVTLFGGGDHIEYSPFLDAVSGSFPLLGLHSITFQFLYVPIAAATGCSRFD